jgi:hypothetical protein
LAWGLVYGLAWWFLGPLTLLPTFLGAGIQWSLAAALDAYPSLIGHLAYGGATALAYRALARRNDPAMGVAALPGAKRVVRRGPLRQSGTPAAALWALVLVTGVMLPLILGGAGGSASGYGGYLPGYGGYLPGYGGYLPGYGGNLTNQTAIRK